MQKMGSPLGGPVRIENIAPAEKLHVLQDGPKCDGNGCHATVLGEHAPLCFSSILPSWEGTEEAETPLFGDDPYISSVAIPTLVPDVARHEYRYSAPAASREGFIDQSAGRVSPTAEIVKPTASGMANLQRQLQTEGISGKAIELIVKRRAKGTRYNYNQAWTKFCSWVNTRGLDPIHCGLSTILNYLCYLYDEGKAYRHINVQRSAISAFHPKIPDGTGQLFDVGKHPRVCELLAGISKERPPQARYSSTWDVSKVIEHFQTRGSNEDFSLKELSLKLVLLISLCSLNRGMETHMLTIDKMSISPDKVSFDVEGIVKHSNQGKTNPPLCDLEV